MTERSYSDKDADSALDDEVLIQKFEAREDKERGDDVHNLDTFGEEEYPDLLKANKPGIERYG